MKNYDEMSDFEVNKDVALALLDDDSHWSTWVSDNHKLGKVWFVDESNNNKAIEFDPCNNSSDAWPIIVENLISVECNKHDSWTAIHTHGFEVIEVSSSNPLRAAMICFLKMKDAES